MSNQISRRNPLEDQIIEEIAQMVAMEMTTEIQDEVSVWVHQLPITSPKVRRTSVTRVFQERFAQQLALRQEQIEEQIIRRRRIDTNVIPTGTVQREITTREEQEISEKEEAFLAHLLKCALLSSRIEVQKKAFEEEDERIVEKVEREMEGLLKINAERWMEMGKVSESEFEKEWEENFGGERVLTVFVAA